MSVKKTFESFATIHCIVNGRSHNGIALVAKQATSDLFVLCLATVQKLGFDRAAKVKSDEPTLKHKVLCLATKTENGFKVEKLESHFSPTGSFKIEGNGNAVSHTATRMDESGNAIFKAVFDLENVTLEPCETPLESWLTAKSPAALGLSIGVRETSESTSQAKKMGGLLETV